MKKLTIILALLLLCTAGGRKKERIETPQAGAVVQMGFNDGDRAHDDSGQGNDGTVDGATHGLGYTGGGYSFDGTNDNILLPNAFSSDTVGAISIWANSDTIDAGINYIFGTSDSGDGNSYFGFSTQDLGVYTDRLVLGVQEAGSWSIQGNGGTTLLPGVWYHFVIQQTGSGWEMYINGVKETITINAGRGSVANTEWISYIQDIDKTFIGGLTASGTFYPFDGDADELYIYNRPLTAAEIKQLHGQGRANANP